MSSSPPGGRADLAESLTWAQVRTPLVRSVVAMLALVAAGLVGFWSAHPSRPGDGSIEAGYVRDTAAHHAQAVAMSWTIQDATTAGDVDDLARSVITAEQGEIGRAEGFLTDWGLPTRPDGRRMDWMRRTGHQHAGLPRGATLLPDGRMPGTASPAQLAALGTARGRTAEVLYLQLMILHDRATIQMSAAVQSASSQTGVVQLAGADLDRSRRDLTRIRAMLTARGATPWTSTQAGQPVVGP